MGSVTRILLFQVHSEIQINLYLYTNTQDALEES